LEEDGGKKMIFKLAHDMDEDNGGGSNDDLKLTCYVERKVE